MFKRTLLFFGFLFFSIPFITSCKNEIKESIVREVVTSEVIGASDSLSIKFNGYVVESKITNLSFRVGGPLMGVYAQVGDFVKKGSLLAVIDNRDYEIVLEKAKAQFEQSQAEYDRFLELFNNNKVAANNFEKIRLAYIAAKKQYESAKNAYEDTRLVAPFDGYIHKRNINNYETVSNGAVAYTIIASGEMEVVFGVPERIVSTIGQYNLCLVSASDTTFKAKHKSTANKSENGLYEVRYSFNNSDISTIKPGMTVKITLSKTADQKSSVVVPIEAVFYKSGQAYVWYADKANQSVRSQKIDVISLNDGDKVEVGSGLSVGDLVVIAGVNSLYENQRVIIK